MSRKLKPISHPKPISFSKKVPGQLTNAKRLWIRATIIWIENRIEGGYATKEERIWLPWGKNRLHELTELDTTATSLL